MKLYAVILLTAVLSASAASAAWYVCYRKAVKAALARSSFSPSITVTQRPIERVSAFYTTRDVYDVLLIQEILLKRLSGSLLDFWRFSKIVDQDIIKYRADIWLCRPPEE